MSASSDQDDAELVRLLMEVEKFARELVEEAGGCPPFGGLVKADGEVTLLVDGHSAGVTEGTPSVERMHAMVRSEAARESARAAAAVAMAYIRVGESTQQSLAIAINLHHRAGRCVDYAIPFTKAASGAVRFSEPIAGVGQTRFF